MANRRDNKNRLLQKGEYQKADGRYMYRYQDALGTPHCVYSWTLTKTDRTPNGKRPGKSLRELEQEIQIDVLNGINTHEASKRTLNDLVDRYFEERKDLKATTRMSYRYVYNTHARNSIGTMNVSKIRYSDVKALYLKVAEASPTSIFRLRNILNPVFRSAVRDGLMRINPADGALSEVRKIVNLSVGKRHALTIQEQKAFLNFLDETKHQKWAPLFRFLLYTGCRIGEALALTWDDCDFKQNLISIRKNLTYAKQEAGGKFDILISTTKTSAGVRQIPMFPSVRTLLLRIREDQMRSGIPRRECCGYSGFIFVSSRDGKPANTRTIQRSIVTVISEYNDIELKRAAEQKRSPVLLPQFSPHVLRHTFCTRLCEST